MNAVRFAPAVFVVLVCCSGNRQQECGRFLPAIKPLEQGTPSANEVEGIDHAISAIQYQDQPLREYASSTKKTLASLTEALRMQAGPAPPDGIDDVVKAKLAQARGEADDVTRYCAE